MGVEQTISPAMAGMVMNRVSRRPKAERILQPLHLSGGCLPAHGGKDRLGNRNGEDPLGKLEQSLGIVEIGDAPLGKERGQDVADRDVQVVDPDPEHRRPHEEGDLLHCRMAEIETGTDRETLSVESRELQEELE